MRASRQAIRKRLPGNEEIHISGAEGIYAGQDIQRVLEHYLKRAEDHPRGKPDKISITIEKIGNKPLSIAALPVSTAKASNAGEADRLVEHLLGKIKVSEKAISKAFRVLRAGTVMRGAALILSISGRRMEPNKKRGVRVSRLGITPNADKRLSEYLRPSGINNNTVKEALVLASKVASCRDIIAELCISDDPDYTTGYVASKRTGYVRIPNIKKKGDLTGGRVFFIKETADIKKVIEYLERRPVLVARTTGSCKR